MPKYSGFDPIESHNVVITSASTTGINHDSDPVSVYLPFDSNLEDASANSHTVHVYGDAAISSTQAKFGSNSLSLDGTGDYIRLSDNNDFEFDNGDFTIEAWLYQNDDTGHVIVCKRDSGGAWTSGAWIFGVNTNIAADSDNAGNVEFWSRDYNTSSPLLEFDNGSAFSSGWHHFAVTRAGDNLSLFVDGNQVDTQTWQGTIDNAVHSVYIGRDTYGSGRYSLNGYIDDFRILKGVARYTKSFVPPSQAVGATLNGKNETNTTTDFTSLYLPLDSDVNDDSDNPFTITASGDAAISSAQSKFGGYSLALDGSGDYLTVGSSQSAMAFSRDFTIEFWMYFTSLTGDYVGPMGCHSGSGWLFQFSNSGGRFYIDGSNELTTTATTSTGQWYHVAVSRSGSTVKLFIDGVEQESITYSSALPTNNNLIIGASNASGQYFPGYLDDIRILDGYGKYTTDFVLPTSAVGTSVSESVNDLTVLYMQFDDDSLEDQARNHGATKNGNATLNTSVKKFGTSSLYVDGVGDFLTIPSNGDFLLGDKDFTIESYVYRTANPSYGVITALWDSSGNQRSYIARFNNHNPYFYYSANGIDYTERGFTDLTASLNTWHHIAWVRESDTLYCYLDGVKSSSSYSFSGASFLNGTGDFSIGCLAPASGGTNFFYGYIDDLRIIRGRAIYTSAFTAPTSAVGVELSESSTSQSTDTKSLSSTWTMTNDGSSPRSFIDMRSDNTWANNEHLQSQPGHRWYSAPAGPSGTPVTFKVWGAGGGGGWWNGGSSGSGGSGGFAKGTLPAATPGTTYNVIVGPAGGTADPAVPSATGGGGAGTSNGSHKSGSGGSFSGVFEGPVSIGNAIIIAGGGGGAGSYDRSGEDESGGGGGGTTGIDAANPGPAIGKAGTQSGGGYPYAGGGAGAALQGGDGRNRFSMGGGGGGGGYYGGSGGGVDGSEGSEEISGGGGGSGYVSPALSDTANLQGVTGTAGSTPGQNTAINPTASSDPDYTGSYGKGGGFNSDGNGGYVVITSPSGSSTFTSPGTYTVP